MTGSLLESNKDYLLNQAKSDLAKQELHVESLNKCIGEQHRQTEEQRLAIQDAQNGFVESTSLVSLTESFITGATSPVELATTTTQTPRLT